MRKTLLLTARLWTNIMVMILSFITFFVTSTLYNRYQSFYATANYYSKTPLNSSVMFLGREPAMDPDGVSLTDPKYINEFVNYAKSSDIVDSVSGMYNTLTYIDENDIRYYNIIRAYDKTTASFIKDTMRIKGKWLFEEENSEYYPVVVKNGKNTSWNIGDVMSLELELFSPNELTDNNPPRVKATVECIVSGIVDEPVETVGATFFLGLLKRNHTDTVENTFLQNMTSSNDTVIFFPNDGKLFNDYVYTSDTVLAYFKENVSQEQINEFYSYACELGYAELGSDIVAASRAQGDYEFRKNFFVFYTLIILTIVSVFCISFLNVNKVKKLFAVYYLNGCTKIQSVGVYFLYFILLYTLPLLLYIILTQVMYSQLSVSSEVMDYLKSEMFRIDIKIPIFSWLIGLLISAFASVAPFAVMKRKTIIQNLKEE